MGTTLWTVCIIGMVLSVLGMYSTKRVADWIAPKKESLMAIPRTIISMMWFVAGPFICLIALLVFGLVLALAN